MDGVGETDGVRVAVAEGLAERVAVAVTRGVGVVAGNTAPHKPHNTLPHPHPHGSDPRRRWAVGWSFG